MDNLATALEITAIGMGLVFGAILLIWGLIYALVNWTNYAPFPRIVLGDAKAETPPEALMESPLSPDPLPEAMAKEAHERKVRAAAIAVAIALTERQMHDRRHFTPRKPIPSVSHWQSHLRTYQMQQRGRLFRR